MGRIGAEKADTEGRQLRDHLLADNGAKEDGFLRAARRCGMKRLAKSLGMPSASIASATPKGSATKTYSFARA